MARSLYVRRWTVIHPGIVRCCPERAAPSKRQSRIDRHLNYLSRRWAEGCHNSAQLHREILARMCYTGTFEAAELVIYACRIGGSDRRKILSRVLQRGRRSKQERYPMRLRVLRAP